MKRSPQSWVDLEGFRRDVGFWFTLKRLEKAVVRKKEGPLG